MTIIHNQDKLSREKNVWYISMDSTLGESQRKKRTKQAKRENSEKRYMIVVCLIKEKLSHTINKHQAKNRLDDFLRIWLITSVKVYTISKT